MLLSSMAMEYSQHFTAMLRERNIQESWVHETVEEPARVENKPDGTRHFLRNIEAHGNRWLRIVINIRVEPHRAVTAFFDRRVKGAV